MKIPSLAANVYESESIYKYEKMCVGGELKTDSCFDVSLAGDVWYREMRCKLKLVPKHN